MGEIISTGTVIVKSGTTLTEPDIRNYGMVIISSGGLVRNAHIFYGGKEVISSGGADYGARIESSAFGTGAAVYGRHAGDSSQEWIPEIL